MMAAGGGRGVSRVLGKLHKSVQDGNFYEAHQMYKTLYFRYNNQKKYDDALELLYNGSLTLLDAGQQQSGADLAMMFLDTLEKGDKRAEDKYITQVGKLHQLISVETPERQQYVSVALKWSRRGNKELHTGHPELHQRLAITLWHEKDYPSSRYHFLHSRDGEGCAQMLVEYQVTAGYPSEVDLFLTQAVLQYLCLKNKATAESCFASFTKQHPQMEPGPPFYRPLVNFLWLLLIAVEGGKVAVFAILCEQYQTALQRDPSYNEYLDRIGQIFFGMPPPQAADSSSGMFGNLLNSLLGMEEDSDSEEPTSESRSIPTMELD